jgi:hypothetical protein
MFFAFRPPAKKLKRTGGRRSSIFLPLVLLLPPYNECIVSVEIVKTNDLQPINEKQLFNVAPLKAGMNNQNQEESSS